MIESILFIVGIFLGILWWSFIVLPIFYGAPKAIYYIQKDLLRKSAIFFYLKSFFLWNVILFGIAFILVRYFPNLVGILLESAGFAMGQLIGIGMGVWRVFTKQGRRDLNIDFWDVMSGSRILDSSD